MVRLGGRFAGVSGRAERSAHSYPGRAIPPTDADETIAEKHGCETTIKGQFQRCAVFFTCWRRTATLNPSITTARAGMPHVRTRERGLSVGRA